MNNPRKIPQGDKFKKLKSQLAQKKGVTNPDALAATIGRKKFGKKKMAQMAVVGRARYAGRSNA